MFSNSRSAARVNSRRTPLRQNEYRNNFPRIGPVAIGEKRACGLTLIDPTGRLGTPPVTLVETGDVDAMTGMLVAAVGYDPVA